MKRILVIDNEAYIQEVTCISLETVAGWQVITASSGCEGLLKAAAEQPDAILLDVMMPDMDGLATCQKLQANPVTRAIPVLLMTATLQLPHQKDYVQMGIKGAIAKPFDPLTLAEQIAEALKWEL